MTNDAKLAFLRVQLYTAAQDLEGDDLQALVDLMAEVLDTIKVLENVEPKEPGS